MPDTAPYGSWNSPISADLIVSRTLGLASAQVDGSDVYWLEMRPAEKGRMVVVRRGADGNLSDITPEDYNTRSRVHEYGGGAYTVADGEVYFCNFSDQRVYAVYAGGQTRALTAGEGVCYADLQVDRTHARLICVREDLRGGQTLNTLVSIPLDAGETLPDEQTVLVEGHDFFACPRLRPDGRQLAWISWDHPNMPWDGSTLWLANVLSDGSLSEPRAVAGGEDESIDQPAWSPRGELYFISDRSNWWNLYRLDAAGAECLHAMDAEFGLPHWVFGRSTYAFMPDGGIIAAYTRDGLWQLGRLYQDGFEPIESPFTDICHLHPVADDLIFIGGSASQDFAVVRYCTTSGEFQRLKLASSAAVDAARLSSPQAIEFATTDGRTAHALYYPPANPDYEAPAGETPPLLVRSHGGPTTATSSVLNLGIQYWTSRGFAMLDVNYGGSTGYGREYRNRLRGQWGVVDVDDCVNAALHLVGQGRVDSKRMSIRGSSAGGYTTLCALTFRDVFSAGCDLYGVSDLTGLAGDTHKFESRYLDRLVGPYPDCADLYEQRSPVNHTERLSVPIIFFQGLEDLIVPPAQTEQMVAALRRQGLPVAYLAYEGEQHGFRQADNIRRTLEAELYFYGRIFDFEPADELAPVDIENLD